jgi:hypothetical protein
LVDLTLDHWCSPCPLKQLRPARHCPTTRLPFRRQLAVQVVELQVPRVLGLVLVLVLVLALAPPGAAPTAPAKQAARTAAAVAAAKHAAAKPGAAAGLSMDAARTAVGRHVTAYADLP